MIIHDGNKIAKVFAKDPIRAMEMCIEPTEKIRIALVKFIRRMTNTGEMKCVLGLSGGIDSALIAFLVVEAIGVENLICVSMPSTVTFGDNRKYQNDVIEPLGASLRILSIIETQQAIRKEYAKGCHKGMSKMAFMNVQARIRMIFLYTIANSENAIVIGTDNKSENLTGYFTKFGDGGVDFNPIGELYKTQVRHLAKSFAKFPQSVLNRKPTAGLTHGQTDEDELGITYEKLDTIFFGNGDLELGPNQLPTITNDEFLLACELEQESSHKREMPIAPKLYELEE